MAKQLNWLNYEDFIMEVGKKYEDGDEFFMWIEKTKGGIKKIKAEYFVFSNDTRCITTLLTVNPDNYSREPNFWAFDYKGKFAFDEVKKSKIINMNYIKTIFDTLIAIAIITFVIFAFFMTLGFIAALFTVSDRCEYAGGDYIEVVEPQMCYSVSEDKYLPLSR